MSIRIGPAPAGPINGELVFYFDAGDSACYVSGSLLCNDKSGYLYKSSLCTGSVLNGTGYTSSNGGSMVFDGQNDYLLFEEFGAVPRFTVDCWFVPSKASAIADCVYSSVYATTGVNFKLGYESSTAMYGGFYDFNGWHLTPPVPTTTGSWHNVIFTYDGSNMKIYKNGTFIGSSSYSGPVTSSGGGFQIGKRWDAAGYFSGSVSIVRIYTGSFDQTRVTANFNEFKARFGL